MTPFNYLIFMLGVYGISWILVHSLLLAPVRDKLNIRFFRSLLSCIVCVGVWASAFFCIFYYHHEPWYTTILVVGSTTTTTWILANLLGDSE